jgi:hypothetical protein
MTTTVYFATNRIVNGAADQWQNYTTGTVTPSDPTAVTYGTAFINESSLTADTTGLITRLQDVQRGGFSQQAVDDLSSPGRNLLIYPAQVKTRKSLGEMIRKLSVT